MAVTQDSAPSRLARRRGGSPTRSASLAMDAVEAAKSGHPGMPMGMADIAEVLWNDFLSHNPNEPALVQSRPLRAVERPRLDAAVRAAAPDRLRPADRRDEALPPAASRRRRAIPKRRRRRASRRRPVRSARASPTRSAWRSPRKLLAQRSTARSRDRRPLHLRVHGRRLPDGRHLARSRSLAGTLELGKLIAIYDDNGISIDGEVRRLVHRRHAGALRGLRLGRHRDVDGHDARSDQGRDRGRARRSPTSPTLICCKTIIGFGAPNKQGTASRHGAALGKDEVAAARVALGWKHAAVRGAATTSTPPGTPKPEGAARESGWNALFARYRSAHPDLAAEFDRRMAGELADGLRRARRCVRAQAAGRRPSDRLAQGLADGARGVRAAAAGADRRLGRPRRLEPHDLERLASTSTRRAPAATTSTTACASSA